ncbi:hypothetical protein, partial [Paratractidigestivibacter sp.]|uniref:hypothetical protein n=1 Tax=Paratractidigestivibacter sp. TaxID=2847316 RepID=UPI002AC8A7FA
MPSDLVDLHRFDALQGVKPLWTGGLSPRSERYASVAEENPGWRQFFADPVSFLRFTRNKTAGRRAV